MEWMISCKVEAQTRNKSQDQDNAGSYSLYEEECGKTRGRAGTHRTSRNPMQAKPKTDPTANHTACKTGKKEGDGGVI